MMPLLEFLKDTHQKQELGKACVQLQDQSIFQHIRAKTQVTHVVVDGTIALKCIDLSQSRYTPSQLIPSGMTISRTKCVDHAHDCAYLQSRFIYWASAWIFMVLSETSVRV